MSDYPKQHDEFMTLLGFCITAWAKIEEQLFKICELCLGARPDRVAIVYYRTPTVDARMKLVDELVGTALPTKTPGEHDHPDVITWSSIVKDAGALLHIRRRIAHHPVRAKINLPPGTYKPKAFWYLEPNSWLEIYESETERLRTGKELQPLKTDDLKKHAKALTEVGNRFAQFRKDVLPKHVG
jgi:hypothetical protein